MKAKRAVCATMDTWLLYRLRNVQNSAEKFDPVSDISSVSATSMFDPFVKSYNKVLLKLMKIDKMILPKIIDNSSDFGYTHKSLFGEAIKIVTVISDQSAAMIGNACFRNMDAKVSSMGSIFNLHTIIIVFQFLILDHSRHRLISQHQHRQEVHGLEHRRISTRRLRPQHKAKARLDSFPARICIPQLIDNYAFRKDNWHV